MQEFIAVDTARSIIAEHVSVQPSTLVAIHEAMGRTLAADIVSADAIPPFPNSAMDGYAVRSEDFGALPTRLQLTEEIPAGAIPVHAVASGTCSKIMTGAPMPRGANAVAPIEWVAEGMDNANHEVVFNRAPEAGENVRKAGMDVERGERVMQRGRIVTPPVIGMLATLGFPRVEVYVPPRISIVATGDELIAPGEALTPGKIRNASGEALRAQVQDAGAEALPPLLARDNRKSIHDTIERAMEADALVFAGGVSVGDYDLVKQVLDERGMELLFWKVKQRPGKPFAFGMLQGKPVFGLPGNPVSSAMCFDQFVRPALALMLGRRDTLRPRYRAVLTRSTPKVKGLHFFARGIAHMNGQAQLEVEDTGPQGSNLYSSVVKANCIIHLEEAVEAAPAGTIVDIEWLPWSA